MVLCHGRRNINSITRVALALELEKIYKEKGKENQAVRKGKQVGASLQNSVNLEKVNTQKELAKIAGVSHDTIHKGKVVLEKATPEQKEKLRSGDESINKIYTEIKRTERKETQLQKEKDAPVIGRK